MSSHWWRFRLLLLNTNVVSLFSPLLSFPLTVTVDISSAAAATKTTTKARFAETKELSFEGEKALHKLSSKAHGQKWTRKIAGALAGFVFFLLYFLRMFIS